MKEQLRKQYKQLRQQLSQEQVVQCSNQIASALFQTPFWKNSRVIMLYLSFQNEVDTPCHLSTRLDRREDDANSYLLPTKYNHANELYFIFAAIGQQSVWYWRTALRGTTNYITEPN